MDCSLKIGITIDSGSSAATGVPDDTFVSISISRSHQLRSIRSGQSLLLRPDLTVPQIPAPRCLQTSFKVRWSIVTEFARCFGDITPSCVNIAGEKLLVTNLHIAPG